MNSNRSSSLSLAGLFTALTVVGAFIKIPFFPVPITLQSLFALLAGCVLAARYALLSQVAYLLLGLMGLPVFANGGGIGYILQPTFGYLMGLPVAAYLVARLVSRAKSFYGLVAINFLAAAIILAMGIIWLYLSLHYFVGKPLSLTGTIYSGAIIFLPGELVKAVIAAFTRQILVKRILFSRRENG